MPCSGRDVGCGRQVNIGNPEEFTMKELAEIVTSKVHRQRVFGDAFPADAVAVACVCSVLELSERRSTQAQARSSTCLRPRMTRRSASPTSPSREESWAGGRLFLVRYHTSTVDEYVLFQRTDQACVASLLQSWKVWQRPFCTSRPRSASRLRRYVHVPCDSTAEFSAEMQE